MTVVVMICLSVDPEKEGEELTNAERFTHEDKEISEAQEDDGDWEQVGPRNKSMVTRMVRCEWECTLQYSTAYSTSAS